ncbi:MerR family transcriptional regulator [Ammonicoccus fulvus]|uniref:MerR family transcriptional regulator n=1 Tax=Ammonicoccus fulvus TaxID=3138240 RepID=A0ABZ3FW68_9ACTN
MLTIGQLAEYAGTTVRAIRHYHQVGLLEEPARDASGYRSYGAQSVVDLKRIRVLADAGVPLKRIGELMHASPDELSEAVAEIDRDLRAQVRKLQATRKALAALALDEPFLPPELLEVHEEIRRRASEAGVSPRTLEMEREGWILASTLYPELMERWVGTQLRFLEDPEYLELYLLTDQAYDWAGDDPRIDDVARRTVDLIKRLGSVDYEHEAALHTDDRAYALVTTYRLDQSPGWASLTSRVRELLLGDSS